MVWKSVLSLVAAVVVATPSLAQNYPMPTKVGQPAAVCTGCSGNNAVGEPNAGKPTYQYASPITSFVGRLVDSNETKSVQHSGMRTARAGIIRTAHSQRGAAPPRVYVQIGQALGAYSLSTFFTSKLSSPMVPINVVGTGSTYRERDPFERIALFDAHVYPESTFSGGWKVPVADNQDRLWDFDFDDRGYIYMAYDEFGFGIVKDSGESGASHFPKTLQLLDELPVRPTSVFTLKVGSNYYAIVSDIFTATSSVVYDVTTPSAPGQPAIRNSPVYGVQAWAKDEANQVIAVFNGEGKILVFTYANYINGGAPIAEVTRSSTSRYIAGLSFDDQGTLWVTEHAARPAPALIHRLARSGSGYSHSTQSPYPTDFYPKFMHASAGYLAVGGVVKHDNREVNQVFLFKIDGSNLTLLNVDDYFRKYYHAAPSGYAQPGGFVQSPSAVQIIKSGTKTYFMYNAWGLGDVYQLGADGPQLAATMKTASFGTPNPNAKPTQSGPFPGDIVTFTASVTPASTHSLTWNFANPDAGAANTKSGTTGADITHQFTGLNTTTKITTTKNVTATSTSDSQVTDTIPVVLKVPEARIALKSTGELITASGFETVVGDKFIDASDGSVESHVSTWTLGATPSVLRPNDEIDVGALGARSVAMTASYGKYDPATLALPALPYNAVVAAKGYEVKPFVAKLKQATRNGNNVTYGAIARATNDPLALLATDWTVTWSLTAGSTQTAGTSGVVPVGTVPDFTFDKSLLVNGSVIKLVISVAPAAVPVPAYATYELSETVSVPNPVIELTNCNFVNDNCSIKAVAGPGGGSAAGWQLSWSVKRGAANVSSGTGNPLATFKLTQPGLHTVTVTETVFGIEVVKTFDVAQSLCVAPPEAHQLAIGSSCQTCAANVDIVFEASYFQYSAQACDQYSWNFGDGSTATGALATHAYGGPGTYTVSLNVKNVNKPAGTTVTKQITVGGGSNCTAPSSIDFTYASSQGCAIGVNCKTGDSVRFTARRGTANLQNCDNASWSFGDGASSNEDRPSHSFSTPGTYTVSVVISNNLGTAPAVSKTITIVPNTTGCNPGPTEANVSLSYRGKVSGCTRTNGVVCKSGEEIEFESSFFQYSIQPCDRFEWNWGDGTPFGTTQIANHTFPASLGSAVVRLKVYNTASPNGVTLQANVSFGAPAKPQPVLSFGSFPATGAKGTPVTFTVNSNIEATGWAFDFGDGKKDTTTLASHIGTTATIQHIYATAGTFKVEVKARNATDISSAQPGVALAGNPGIVISDIPEYKYLLPVVTHSGGLNNSTWRTDVQIYSDEPGLSPQNPLRMTASLRDINRTLEIFSSTTQYVDFMKVFTNAGDSGPVIITVRSQKAPQIWTRTYNQTSTGTFGQFIPAVRIDAAAGAGSAFGTGKYYMAGLRHDARFRTNLGFINPNSQAINVTVKVYDDQRFPLGQFPLQLQPFQLDQFPITADKAVKNLPPGRPFSLEIDVPPGQWLIGYASFIDNASSDPVYIQAIRESELSLADYSNGIIPGVGHVGEWRSDVTIFNPDTQGVNVDLTYYDQNGTKVAEAKGVPIRGGEFLQYTDFLKQGIFGTVGDSLGILRVTVPQSSLPPSRYPLTFARTYNDKGTGKTFGQGIGGFAAGRANVKVGKPALVPGIRSDVGYYTNFNLVNPGTVDAVALVKVLDPATGAEHSVQSHTIKPNQSLVGRVELGQLETASLKIEVSAGSVWGFCSIVDKGTLDPECVPATPLMP